MFNDSSVALYRARTAAEIDRDSRRFEQVYALNRVLYRNEFRSQSEFAGLRQMARRIKLMVANIFSV